MSDLQLGASTWCFNGLLPPELRPILDGGAPYLPEHARVVHVYFTELVGAVLRSEIKSVELWHSQALADKQVTVQLQRLADAGRISSMHAPFGRQKDLSSLDEGIRQVGVRECSSAARLLSQLGGKTLVVHASSSVENPAEMPERARRSARSIAEIADNCRALGVDIAVEIVGGPAVGSSGPELLALLDLAGRPNVGVCIDVNHVFPPDHLLPTVHLLGPRILTLHICDYDGVAEKHWLPMRGAIDWPGLIGALRQVEYSGPFMYEARFAASSVGEAVSGIEENYRTVMATLPR